jgi:Holliday junction resolvase RusA-like endonuclease
MKEIKFTYYGEPVAKGRPKFFRSKAGYVGTYTPKKTAAAEDDFKSQALKFRPNSLITGEIALDVSFFRRLKKSMSKRAKTDALDGRVNPTTRPDIDNYVKLVCDAMNGLFWQDDAQIVSMTMRKRYSDTPRIEVSMSYTEEVKNT